MSSTATPLQQAYFTLLNGNVTIGGSAVPIYDTVPASPSYPYVQIDDRTAVDYTDKTSLGEEVTQTLWVVDRFSDSFGSRTNLNDITNQVQNIIRQRPVAISMSGWNTLTSTLDIANFSRERTDTHTYFRMELRFRHLIEEL